MTDTGNIHAELRCEAGSEGYYTLRYLVFNGDIIGSYGVHFGPSPSSLASIYADTPDIRRDPAFGGYAYGASRDYHQLATSEQVALQLRFDALPDDEKYEGDNYPPSSGSLNHCEYHDGQYAFCDGSGIVEVIINDDQRAFEIAAMMAGVERDHA